MSNGNPDPSQFNFVRGGDAAAEAAAAAMSSSGGKIHYFNIDKPGDSEFVRFITDQPNFGHAKQHMGVKTKNKPEDWPKDAKWPESMPATCRYDDVFQGYFPDCYVCDNPDEFINQWGRKNKGTVRDWAVAVLREEVRENGVVKGYRDKKRKFTVKENDKEVEKEEIALVMVNQAHGNFFSPLNGFYGVYQTVTDRDYKITKVNEGKDTDFNIVPLDPIETPEGRFAGPKLVRRENGVVEEVAPAHPAWNDRYVKACQEQGYDINKVLVERASDDYWAKFIDPRKKAPAFNKGDGASEGGAPAEQQEQAPANDVDSSEKLNAMRDRVRRGYTSGDGEGGSSDDAGAAEQSTQPASSGAIY
jgi:hypothetical protein